MKVALICLLLFLGISLRGQGQSIPPGTPIGSVYLGLAYSQPTGQFKNTYPNGQGKGGTFGFTIRPGAGTAPIEVGAEISYLPIGIEKHPIGYGSNGYTLKTTHSQIPLHALIRLKPRRLTAVTPYLDGLAGVTVFNSRTKIKEDLFMSLRDEDPIIVSKHTSTALNYGVAAGLSFKLNNRRSFFLDLRLIYLESPLTSFVKKGDVVVDQNGDATYLFTRSENSSFLLQLNLTGILKSQVE